jgi:hypothetical protein
MKEKTKEKNNNILQLKIVLEDTKPKVWRRILVSVDYNFFDLHSAIQDVFGWSGGHLHQFWTKFPYSSRDAKTIGYPFPDAENLIDGRKIKITEYFKNVKDKMFYEYDFGDGWIHSIVLEKILEKTAKEEYPQCVGGENACPPDDCGGIGGYYDLLEILKKPKHKEHKDMLEWLCIESSDEFDPTHFDPKEVLFMNPKKMLKDYESRM